MIVGIPKEKKEEEYRVGGIPETVFLLKEKGHKVFVETNAGFGVGFKDKDYINAGAEICETPEELYGKSQLIVKVKEPLPPEYSLLNKDHIIFTFFHFAADITMTEILLSKQLQCIAYELIEDNGKFPILAPMSEIAGKLAPQQGAKYLEKKNGGKGLLLSGAYKARKGKVVVLGGGVVGRNAATISFGMGAEVVILEVSAEKVEDLRKIFKGKCKVEIFSRDNILKEIKDVDLIVGAVMVAGEKAPKVIKKSDLKIIEDGSVLVDVAIDQGGSFETSRPTSHNQPTYIEEGVLHYCVPNMPGIVPLTSTYSLVAATTPYIMLLADKGIDAIKENIPLSKGYAVGNGKILSEKIVL